MRGVDSAAWRAQLALIDRVVEQLVDGLPDDAALLVTADHGMLDVPADTRFDLDAEPELADGVRVAGRRTARPLRARRARARRTTCSQRWRELLGDRAWVASREEAVASGIFGPVDDALAARIGDVVALARGTWAFTAPRREPGPSRLVAYPRLAHRDRAGDPAAHRPRPRA